MFMFECDTITFHFHNFIRTRVENLHRPGLQMAAAIPRCVCGVSLCVLTAHVFISPIHETASTLWHIWYRELVSNEDYLRGITDVCRPNHVFVVGIRRVMIHCLLLTSCIVCFMR